VWALTYGFSPEHRSSAQRLSDDINRLFGDEGGTGSAVSGSLAGVAESLDKANAAPETPGRYPNKLVANHILCRLPGGKRIDRPVSNSLPVHFVAFGNCRAFRHDDVFYQAREPHLRTMPSESLGTKSCAISMSTACTGSMGDGFPSPRYPISTRARPSGSNPKWTLRATGFQTTLLKNLSETLDFSKLSRSRRARFSAGCFQKSADSLAERSRLRPGLRCKATFLLRGHRIDRSKASRWRSRFLHDRSSFLFVEDAPRRADAAEVPSGRANENGRLQDLRRAQGACILRTRVVEVTLETSSFSARSTTCG